MTKHITIVGGAGFIGSVLTTELVSRGYTVTVLDMHAPKVEHPQVHYVHVDAMRHIDAALFAGSFAVVNLAGASIAKRWTRAYTKVIYDSRITTTKNIVEAFSRMEQKPEVFVSASAVGYYGDRGSSILTENSGAGKDFLSQVCIDWEDHAQKAEEFGIRVVLLRTATVLGPGGMLTALAPLFRRGVGAYIESGRQYMPWVHYSDIVAMYIWALEQPLSGAYNTAAPGEVTQKELFIQFGKSVHAPWVLSLPLFLARIIIGKFTQSLVSSQRVSSAKLLDSGYLFKIWTLSDALKMSKK